MKLSFGILLFTLSLNAFPYTKDKTYKITILHTNDHHGRFWANSDGELGLAARATLIKKLREEIVKEGGHVLLLDAGDVNTGIPQSDLQKAEPDFKGMSKIGYDVMALGNHDFDNPVEILKKQEEWAGFPFISANIYVKKTGQRLFPSHIDKKFEDLKITIFGLTTEDTPLKTNKINTKGLIFRKAYKEAKKLVPLLRKNTDILIGLTHVGHYPNESHGKDAPGDVTIARQTKGIDLIVGGHTQKPLFGPDIQNGTIIVQAYEWGKYVGRVDLEFFNGKVTLKNYKLIPVNLKDSEIKLAQDFEIESFLKPYKETGDKLIAELNKGIDHSKELATSEIDFIGKREIVRTQETNLGNLIAIAYRDKFNADIGLTNSGGIRDSLPAGKITYEAIMTVLPFRGKIVTAKLKGNSLKKYLEEIILTMTPGSGSFPQMCNIEASIDKEKNKVTKIMINGRPISDRKEYKIALPEFIANGGDKYPVLKYEKTEFIDAEVLKDFVVKKKKMTAKDFAPTGYIKRE